MKTTIQSRTTPVRGVQHLSKLFLCGLFLLGANAQAAPLNLVLDLSPDIVSSFIAVSYDAGTDSFAASGFAQELDEHTIDGGSFNLNATIDDTGALSAGGALNIGGTIAGLGFNSGTLLTGGLTVLGFGGGDPLEFLFTVTGGDAAALYGGVGNEFGAIILGSTGFGGNFDSDFSTPFGASADVGTVSAVPLPAAAWLFGSALLGLAGIGRRGRNS